MTLTELIAETPEERLARHVRELEAAHLDAYRRAEQMARERVPEWRRRMEEQGLPAKELTGSAL